MDGLTFASLDEVAVGERALGILGVPDDHKDLRATHMKIGPWSIISANTALTMQQEECKALLERFGDWHDHFARADPGSVHENAARRRLGLHSTLVRADYVWDPVRKVVNVYEFDDRPAGLGVTCILNAPAKDGLRAAVESWQNAFGKPLAFCISEDRKGNSDDAVCAANLFTRQIPVCYGMPDAETMQAHIWWPRISRHEKEYYPLTQHCLSTIALEGDKSYGVPMGMWHKIQYPGDIPLDAGCALKPAVGSRFETIKLVRKNAGRGFITPSGAVKLIEQKKFAYWQPLHEPERSDRHGWLKPEYCLVRRVYLAYIRRPGLACEGGGGGFCVIGGVALATPGHRVHGTRDSLTVPIYPPKPYAWID